MSLLDADEVDEAVNTLREATREEHAAAVDALIEPIEEAIADALARVWHDAMRRAGALVAAVDPNGLGPIAAEWDDEVKKITPIIGEVYEAGALSAWQQHAGAHAAAGLDPALSPQAVVDLGAIDRASEAANRMRDIGDRAWEDARTTIAEGIEKGWDIEQTSAALEDRLAVNQSRARTVARTETISAANAGSLDAVKALGRYGPRIKEWMASMDSRTRDTHYSADGQRRARDMPFQVGASRMQYPGDPSGSAAETINCRCTILWIESGTEILPPGENGEAAPRPVRDPEDLSPVERPPDPPDPPRVLSPEERFAADIADHRTALRTDLDRAHEDWLAREFPDPDLRENVVRLIDNDPGESGFGRLIPDLAETDGAPSDLLAGIEQRVTEIGARVDDEIERRLAARGIAKPTGSGPQIPPASRQALIDEFDELRAEKRRIERRILNDLERDYPKWTDRQRASEAHRLARLDPEAQSLSARMKKIDEAVNDRSNPRFTDATRDYRDAWAREFRGILDEIDGTGQAPTIRPSLGDDIPGPVRRLTKRHLNPDEAKALGDAVKDVYPRRWIQRSDDAGAIDSGMSTDGRGWSYTWGSPNRRGVIALSESYAPGSTGWNTLSIHEFGHRLESTIPGIRQLEYAFYGRRTAGETPQRLMDLIPGSGYDPTEVARPDKFAQMYSGKAYEGHSQASWELFTMAAETYLPDVVEETKWTNWGRRQFDDDDMRRWFLGVMLSAG